MNRDSRRRNRTTLRHLFREGALPSAQDFADLVESSVNQIDDGFDKTDEDGLKIWTAGEESTLLSFYRQSPDQSTATWTVRYDQGRDTLLFRPNQDADESVVRDFSLSPDGHIGINTTDPKFHLDVSGSVRAGGRIGATDPTQAGILANGQWHDISPVLAGCHAVEVVAGVGEKGTGRYALLRAIAVNAYNPRRSIFRLFRRDKKPIRAEQAVYNSWRDRLRLRWIDVDSQGRYRLQLRSNCKYSADTQIRYYITKLWFDPGMQGSTSDGNAFSGLNEDWHALGDNHD